MFVEDVSPMPTTVTTGVARNRVNIALYDLHLKHKASLAKARVHENPNKLLICKKRGQRGVDQSRGDVHLDHNRPAKQSGKPNDVHLGVF